MSISLLILSLLALTWLIIIIIMNANKWKITGSGLFLTACLLGLTTSMNQNQTLFHLLSSAPGQALPSTWEESNKHDHHHFDNPTESHSS